MVLASQMLGRLLAHWGMPCSHEGSHSAGLNGWAELQACVNLLGKVANAGWGSAFPLLSLLDNLGGVQHVGEQERGAAAGLDPKWYSSLPPPRTLTAAADL